MKIIFNFFLLILLIQNVYADELKLGGVYSLSGFGDFAGEAEMLSAKLAIDEINQSGGIAGKKIKFIVEDNSSSLRKTASAVNKLLNVDKVDILLGPNWAEFAEIAAPIAERAEVPMLTASGNKQGLTAGKKYVFTLFPDHHDLIGKFAEYILQQKHQNIALVVAQNAYYEEISDGIEQYFSSKNFNAYKKISTSEDASEYKVLVSKLKNSSYDAVITLLMENSSIDFYFNEVFKQDLTLPQYSSLAVRYSSHLKKFLHKMDGLVIYDYQIKAGDGFDEKYKSTYNKPTVFGGANSYDSVYLLKSVIEKCGFDKADIAECLANSSYSGVIGKISFDEEHQLAEYGETLKIMKVQDGNFVEIN